MPEFIHSYSWLTTRKPIFWGILLCFIFHIQLAKLGFLFIQTRLTKWSWTKHTMETWFWTRISEWKILVICVNYRITNFHTFLNLPQTFHKQNNLATPFFISKPKKYLKHASMPTLKKAWNCQQMALFKPTINHFFQ